MSDSDEVISESLKHLADKLNDPIIQKILEDRKVELDEIITQEDEFERQKKMYLWLRNSKKYRKLQVQDANQKEKNINLLDMKSIQDTCDSINDLQEASTIKPDAFKPNRKISLKSNRRVTFCESNNQIMQLEPHSDLFDHAHNTH